MNVKWRVVSHEYMSEELTRIRLSLFDPPPGTMGSTDLTVTPAAAAQYPVGGAVDAVYTLEPAAP
ncbi:MAG TPA: hypothetical protein VJN67_21470 [Stellaceae bacterium]|nr:hypothetical protein [Stellaceae bacterium]